MSLLQVYSFIPESLSGDSSPCALRVTRELSCRDTQGLFTERFPGGIWSRRTPRDSSRKCLAPK